jgi:opacity protein-like surface antigen/outer membrane protease
MRELVLRNSALIGLMAIGVAGGARAADMPVIPVAPPPGPVWNWTGGYTGLHAGALWGDTHFSDPLGPSIYGDEVATPGYLGGVQAGYNWQVPQSRWVLGIEADLSLLASVGTDTCLAYSANFVSANCRSRPNFSTTLTPRIGYAIDPEKRTLVYLKGGLAAVHDTLDIATNAVVDPSIVAARSPWMPGWTAGAGVERALTPAWSLRFEYDFLAFGRGSMATPASFFQVIPGDPFGYLPTLPGTAEISQSVQEIKFGLNYRIGIDPSAFWLAASPVLATSKAPAPVAVPAVVPSWTAGWEFELGGRYWYSFGKFQKDLGSTTTSATANVLNSRLTYNSTANSGEIFARAESPQNIFVKGFLGTGAMASGHMNDEDWALDGGLLAYSNTVSNPVKGTISYATGDVGYDIFRAADYSLGPIVGYSYYRDKEQAYGCVQIANPLSDCVPAIPSSELGISENDTWNAVRTGVNGEVMLIPRTKLSVDVAYLPYVQFNGTDIHWQRTDVPNQTSPETGRGTGIQLDAILSYYITPAFEVGVGGRYWAMWTSNSAYTNIFSTPCPCQTEPVKAEQYGLLVQADYKFEPWPASAKF